MVLLRANGGSRARLRRILALLILINLGREFCLAKDQKRFYMADAIMVLFNRFREDSHGDAKGQD